MRILGLRAKDESMTQAYFDGQDIHKATASLAFDTPIEEVTKDQRQAAKAIAFGEPQLRRSKTSLIRLRLRANSLC